MITIVKKYKGGKVLQSTLQEDEFPLFTEFHHTLQQMIATECELVVVTLDDGLQVLYTKPDPQLKIHIP